ncbi:DUF305 domain-containing protein [Actinoplanes lobatus]|uniref:DUF305 domain-containing protein n=1 Tax=Actinoplanes lobatus TaxID=113568 RepID=A0A7W7HMY1_9ACTN|nr:DUF305 domain-containing protein [Actinoplanes lobatus]MBB4753434.1 hypothetical protein [Actinoplanes lobatus]
MNPLSLACVTAALLALTGCGEPPTPAAPTPAAPPPAVSSTAFGGTDRAWLEITIAMDEQLLPLLDLVPRDSALEAVSAQVRAFTEAELAELRRLGAEAGLPAENQHKGMPMPGMVMPSHVSEATALRGGEFDELLRSCLRAHLEQSRKLAEGEQAAGLEPRTTALAARISETRRTTLSAL